MHQEYIYMYSCTSVHVYIYMYTEQCSQSTSWTSPSREDLRHWKGQERSMQNHVRQKKEGKKKRTGSGIGSASRWGIWRSSEVPASRETPLWRGRLDGTEGNHLGLLEGSEIAGLWQAGQSETYIDDLCHSLCLRAWDLCLSVCVGTGCWNIGDDRKAEERTAAGCK